MKTVMRFIRVPLAVGLLMLVMSAPIALGQESLVNEYCPVSPDEQVDPAIHEEYEGRTVYFCCNKCRRKFLANPEKYVMALPGLEADAAKVTEHAESAVHNHAEHVEHADHDGESGVAEKLDRYLGNLHPLVVHFPIAFVLLAFVMEWLSAFNKSDKLSWAAGWVTGCAALSAVPAVWFGWESAEHAAFSSDTIFYLTMHRWLGVSVLVLSFVAWLAVVLQYRKQFRFLITVLALLVTLTGFFGASLVYGPDHLAW